jgi:signal transduction histidine kinase
LLAGATLVPIGALGWLGARILQQEREMEQQRRRESLEIAAGRLALDIDRRLTDIEEQLARGGGIRLMADGPEGQELLYVPHEPAPVDVSAHFAEADTLEFRQGDLAGAAASCRRLAESKEPAVRAAALNRLGRVLRKAGNRAAAFDAYSRLLDLGTVPVEGQPAVLLARQARTRVLEETADTQALRHERIDLAAALYSGGWRLDKPTFDLYRDLVRQWGGPSPPQTSILHTEAAIAFWRIWRAGELAARGRRILRVQDAPVLAVWAGAAVWLALPVELDATLGRLWQAHHLAVSLHETDGQPMLGVRQSGAVAVTPAQTHLPFILSVAESGTAIDGGYSMRRTLLTSGLLLVFVFTTAAAFGLYRITTREMELARQQSDFVSAVSHEFRTPITSMRHLTELLVTNSVPTESRKAQYYELLARETERLHRMVESLLSFGRIEAGAYAWRLEPVEPAEFVPGVVEEFRHDPQSSQHELLCEMEEDLPPIRADREALSRALRNLLENAGKYSEPRTSIRVFARRGSGSLLLGVEDHGIGVAPDEQSRIFQKFVRGADARRAGIRGVGIGLALVKRIVEAHGGSVRLTSELGRGSTFVLELPCQES